ncbi:hypothetical protein [Nocardia sp. BMG51109]|uniref:hypothetical protein n=1 Tax=Nocardia sp. BMG51109 TaxID=1056816 RepID=UPI0012ECAD45|nr:hypothetical protein [Nocardia sp. BMG51109]
MPAIVSTVGWNGIGRFRRPGDSKPGESVIERDIFSILNFVFGGGSPNYKVGGRYALRADMMFPIGEQHRHSLVIEYDGAYWHSDDEDTDMNKIVNTLYDPSGPHDIMRLREQPLRRLWPVDVSVPPRADAMTCARLALLHIAHRPEPYKLDHYYLDRIHQFLAFGATRLPEDQIHCDFCLELNYLARGDRPTLDRRGRRTVPDSTEFMEVATCLARLSSRIEDVWRPGDREWEAVETAAHRRRKFRTWLLEQRTNEPPHEDPVEMGTTTPLFREHETGLFGDS